jgi:non-homologous end joining protein Ku
VTKVKAGEVLEVALRPDNKALMPITITLNDDVRVVAEYLETLG